MLDLMRKNAGSWMVKFILGAIIVVFALWGVGYRDQRLNKVAVVNGDVIGISDYKKAYNNILEGLKQRFGDSLNEDLIKTLQIEKQALNQVIDQRLLINEAERLGFRVSDDELLNAIMNLKAFQIEGVFNKRLFKRVLLNNRLTPEEFEDLQRKSMLIEKLRTFILSGVKVSDLEVIEWYKWSDATVNIDFVLFSPETYDQITISSDEITAYYNEHKASYKTEPMLKAVYLKFDPKTYESKVKVSDYEVKDYYDTNQDDFNVPKTVEARHILLKVDENASKTLVEEKRKKAEEIYKEAIEGKDFATLARQYSEGPSRDTGGYLGAFQKEMMVEPFADKAFSMKAGGISEPVRTTFGWHIIKVEKINEERVTSFIEAEEGIRKKIIEEKAKNLAYDDAEMVADACYNGEALIEVAKARGFKLHTTEFFSKSQPAKGIAESQQFTEAAFRLVSDEVSEVLDFSGRYYIVKITDRIKEKIPAFDEVKERVSVDLLDEKKNTAARDDANQLLQAVKKGADFRVEAAKFSLSPVSTGFFKRNDSIPNIGFEQEVSSEAFRLSKEKYIGEKVIETQKGYYVIVFKERKEPDPEKIGLKKENIRDIIFAQKQRKIFTAYLAQLKKQSDIVIEDAFMENDN